MPTTTTTKPACATWCNNPNQHERLFDVWEPCRSSGEITIAETNEDGATVYLQREPSDETAPRTLVVLEPMHNEGVFLTPGEARRLAGELQRAAARIDKHPAGTKLTTN